VKNVSLHENKYILSYKKHGKFGHYIFIHENQGNSAITGKITLWLHKNYVLLLHKKLRFARKIWQQTEVAGKASWQPFAPPQEMIGSDDDDDDGCMKNYVP
jgi:hypothetical protein